ncbi:hypothetical protein HDR66_01620 [bacterium]|nr:hypothetical protein [bacterium]
MKKTVCFVFSLLIVTTFAHGATTSCGAGYVLTSHANIDGIPAAECQKLWCTDMETGKSMGTKNAAASGYKATSAPVELCDANGICIQCFGERKWCGGEVTGNWNPEYGAYTRGGDSATYSSYQKGSCFAWRLEKPDCPDGETAVLVGNEWHCATSSGSDVGSRASSIRRTGTLRRGRIQ